MKTIAPLLEHDEEWLATRPLKTLHRMLRGATAEMMKDVRDVVAAYANHTEKSTLVMRKG